MVLKKIKSKLTISFMLLSVLPVLAVGLFSYIISKNAILNKLNYASLSVLEQINKNIDSKVEIISKYMDFFSSNEDIQRILTTVDFNKPTGEVYIANYELDQVIGQIFRSGTNIRFAFFSSSRGGAYIYKGYISNLNLIKESSWYKELVQLDGKLLCGEIIPNPDSLYTDEQMVVFGKYIKDTSYKKNLVPVGTAAVFLGNEIFSGSYSEIEIEPSDRIVFADRNGTLFAKGEKSTKTNLRDYQFGDKIMSESQGHFRYQVDGRDMMVVFYTSHLTGWKIFRMTPYNYYIKDIYNIAWITVIICIACILLISITSSVLADRISKPIHTVVAAMHRVVKKDFSVSVPVNNQDEIGMICEGFNYMVRDIGRLFDLTVEKEKSKKDAEIRALQYQINPHFLYNTLSSIRFVAMRKNDDDISEMTLVLSRLLRNTLNKCGELIQISEELMNLKDYLFIQQIRYKGRISVSFQIDESVKQYKVPNVILQPIVENSIEHGLSGMLSKGVFECLIRISAYKTNHMVHFEIWDNGIGMTQSELSEAFNSNNDKKELHYIRIGIKNIHDRLKMQFGPEYGLDIESEPGRFTLVRLNIPVIMEMGGE